MSRKTNGKKSRVRGALISFMQRFIFTLEQFGRHEMANHASAGAYAFLLSAMPALLVILFATSMLAKLLGLDTDAASAFISRFLGPLDAKRVSDAFISRPLAGAAGIFGLFNLVWAARLFIVSIQRGIRVVWSGSGKATAVRDNIITFAFELVVLLAAILILAGSQLALAVFKRLGLVTLAVHALRLAPALALLLFVYATYRSIPPAKPAKRIAAGSAAACIAVYTLVAWALGLLLNTARYDLLYGFFGNLIVFLVNIYTFFFLYYYFAEFTHTLEYFDAMLFSRFRKVTSRPHEVPGLERRIFSEPERLFRQYSRSYARGEAIFRKGERDTTVFFAYRGAVGIYLDAAEGNAEGVPPSFSKKVSIIPQGEFFGEMAHILDEPRSANAVAEEDSVIFALPPELFDRHLRSDPEANVALVGLLAERIKHGHTRMADRNGEGV